MARTESKRAGGDISLLDVNALIALHDPNHVHHGAALDWFLQHEGSGWATCALTQNGCLRVITQSSYPSPVTMQVALAMLSRSCAQAHHQFWGDDVSLLDAALVDHAHVHGHRQLTDIYLLALAVKHEGRLVTFDARIPLSAVRGAKAHHLVAI